VTEQEMAQVAAQISTQVVNDTELWIGIIGVAGVIIGSIITITGNLSIEWFKNKDKRSIDKARQEILKEMLNCQDYSWRKLSTLSCVIGCSEEQTRHHLIAIGARGSENGKDGESTMWGLITKFPLKSIKR
jgi:hypothetical protein